MAEFGHAMEDASKTSIKVVSSKGCTMLRLVPVNYVHWVGLTQRSVLKGEGYKILDSFKRICEIVPCKTLSYDDFDATKIISCIPIALR
jgi:hypothetical protein